MSSSSHYVPKHRVLGAAAFLAAAVGAIACRNEMATTAGAVRRDSAGVEIVGNAAAVSAAPLPMKATLPGRHLDHLDLAAAGALHLLESGHVLVADVGGNRLVFVDTATGEARSVGRRRSGPAEFTGIRSVHLCANDTIVVRSGLADVKVFGNHGVLARARTGPRFRRPTHGVRGDCGALVVSIPTRDSLRVAWLPLDTDSLRTIVVLADQPQADVPYLDGRATIAIPFSGRPIATAAGDRVYVGRSDVAVVDIYDRAGRLERSVRWDAIGPPMSPEIRSRYDSSRRHLDLAIRPGTAIRVPELSAFTLPDRLPVFSQLVVADDGGLWVRRHPPDWERFEQSYGPVMAASTNEWWVFDATGRLRGLTALPPGFVLKSVEHGFALGLRANSDGFLSVELLPVGGWAAAALERP